ncbi:replication protein RepA [Pseudoroseomonas cervicalis]|uniref:Plasmid encoded RepA protein n=1 Tax=Pseudoroseomonas cervicalis ATCC 49957 TaxID=525371 RepID=D5RGT6_9PROT|nr:replication protein RepA [Pseudoroseomonas cervicalis]EFH13497.1 plasmid encoded RepA protein [Pseudoroseomonas cervicalis ATCC 49957]
MVQRPPNPEPRDEQGDLFGAGASVHQLVEARGAKGAVKAAQLAVLEPKPPSLSRALAGRMGRQIADTASTAIVREFEGGSEIGYSYSAWCLAGLPHRDQPKDQNWLIDTDFARLLVRPGVRLRDDNSQEYIGIPFGSYARLLLIDWQTEALERGSREIHMGRSASAVVARLGINRGGPSNAKVAEQLERLASCAVDFSFGSDKKGVIVNQRLVEAFSYVGEPDPRSTRTSRLVERVLLSQAFFDELRRHPVLVDRAAVRDLTTSPLAIDIYLWLAYRLHSLPKETPIGWDRLWRQFGSKVGALKNFKTQFEGPLHLALSAYKNAKVRVTDRGLLLEPSPPPIRP